jgi:hypothetical protein
MLTDRNQLRITPPIDHSVFKRMFQTLHGRIASRVRPFFLSFLRWWNPPDPAGDREMRWYGKGK